MQGDVWTMKVNMLMNILFISDENDDVNAKLTNS